MKTPELKAISAYILKELDEKGKCVIPDVCTIIVAPARSGTFYSAKDKAHKPVVYTKRLKFRPSYNVKKRLCK